MFDDYDFFGGVNPGGLDGSLGDTGSNFSAGTGGGFDFSSVGSAFDTLGKIGGAVGKVAGSVVQFQTTRDAAQQARETQAFDRELMRLNYDLKKTQAAGAIDVAREQSKLQAAIERAKLAATNGLNGFYNTLGIPAQGGGTNTLMLALAVAGVYFAWKSSK